MAQARPGVTDAVVIVTGAGSGIGRAIAVRFGAAGARVAVNDLDPARAETTVRMIVAAGGTALAVPADVARRDAVDGLFDAVLARLGPVDVLVNNAGLVGESRHFLEGDEAWWDRLLDTNLKGVYLCSWRAAGIMAPGDGASSSACPAAARRGRIAAMPPMTPPRAASRR